MTSKQEMNPRLALRIASAYAGSQAELAKQIGVAGKTITAWIKSGVVSKDYIEKIVEVSRGGVSAEDLAGGAYYSIASKVADESALLHRIESFIKDLKQSKNYLISKICEEHGVKFDPHNMSKEQLSLFKDLDPIYEILAEANKKRHAVKSRLRTALCKYRPSEFSASVDLEIPDEVYELIREEFYI